MALSKVLMILVGLHWLVAVYPVRAQSHETLLLLKVSFDPAANSLSATAKIRHLRDSTFTLNKDMVVNSIAVDGQDALYRRRPALEATTEYVLTSPVRGDLVIHYAGPISKSSFPSIIGQVNMIEPKLVELANYVTWYPRPAQGYFACELEADLPQDFITISNGNLIEEKVEKNRRVTRWQSFGAAGDISLLAAPNLKKKRLERDGTTVEVYFDKLPAAYIDSVTVNLVQATQYFSELFGAADAEDLIRVAYSPRPGWGYVRAPLIIVSEDKALAGLSQPFGQAHDVRYLAHEIAHFWWHYADAGSPQDWINEGLAEYSALLVAEKLYGYNFAHQLLQDYKNRVTYSQTEHAIAETPGDSRDREINRYTKATLLLIQARQKFGDDKFFAFLRELFQVFKIGQKATTDLFLAQADKVIGPDAKTFFAAALYDKNWGRMAEPAAYIIAAADSIFLGTWKGQLTQNGMTFAVILHLAEKGNTLAAWLESPDQGATNIPVAAATITGDSLSFQVPVASVSYSGGLNRDKKIIRGQWRQAGASYALELAK